MCPGPMPHSGEELVDRVSISGAVLASLLEDLAGGQGDRDGLLFGTTERRTVTVLQDHGEEEQAVREESTASLTGHCSEGRLMSFYEAAGAVDVGKIGQMVAGRAREQGDALIGWFVQRRNTPLRPSMREAAVSASLRSTPLTNHGVPPGSPFFFLLFTASQDRTSAIHSYDYKVFQYQQRSGGAAFQPRPVKVVNIGPEFRGQYDAFAPMAPFPHLSLGQAFLEPGKVVRAGSGAGSAIGSGTGAAVRGIGDEEERGREGAALGSQEEALRRLSEGFSMERLGALMGREGARQVDQLEALYRSMLTKLETVAREVCESSKAVQNQAMENQRLQRGQP